MSLYSDDIDMDSSEDEASIEVRTRRLILEQRNCHQLAQQESHARPGETKPHEPCPLSQSTPVGLRLTSMDRRARSLDRLLDAERYQCSRFICSDFAEQDDSAFRPYDFDIRMDDTLEVEKEETPPDDVNQQEFEYLASCLRDFVALEIEDVDDEYPDYAESEVLEDAIRRSVDELSMESVEEEEWSDEEGDQMAKNTKQLVKLIKKHGGKGIRKYGDNLKPLGPCLKRICDGDDKKGDGKEGGKVDDGQLIGIGGQE